MVAGGDADAGAEGEVRGIEGDCGDHAALAVAGEVGHQLTEAGDLGGEAFEDGLVAEDLEAGEGGGAAELAAGVAVTVEEGAAFGGIAEEAVEDALGGEGGGEGEVAASEAFGEAEEVGGDAFLLAGEHSAGAAEAGHDFVEDEEDVVLMAPVVEAFEHALGPEAHAGSALDEGLDDDGGGAGEVVWGQGGEGVEAGDGDDAVAEVIAAAFEEGDAAEAGGTEGVAMVGAVEGDEGVALRTAVLLPVLEGHADGGFDGGGAVVGEEGAGDFAAGEEIDEFFGEADGGLVGEAEEGGVGDAAELVDDGGIDGRVGVAVGVGPDGGVAVEVFFAELVAQGAAVAFDEHEGGMLRGAPLTHGGEGVPEVLFVEVGEVCERGHRLRSFYSTTLF